MTRRFAILPLLLAAALTVEAAAQTVHPLENDVATAASAGSVTDASLLSIEQNGSRADATTMISVDGGRSWRVVSADDAAALRNDAANGRMAFGRISHQNRPAGVSISPNPTMGTTTIRYESTGAEPGTIRVLSIDGREILRQQVVPSGTGVEHCTLDASKIPSGTYMVRVEQQRKVVYTGTLVVAH